ncbi:MAG: hypothetical protein Q8O82_06975 [Pseudorhodobacter sp.]|nr:hypothetical protein [Pseudorhodobacter sp.]
MIARLALVGTLLTAQAAGAQDIGGIYAVQGTNFNGSSYGGQAKIVLTSDVTCEIYWTTGSTTSQGICMRSGDVFSAAYKLGGAVGLVIYRIRADGVLDGSWTIAGASGVGYELLVPQ